VDFGHSVAAELLSVTGNRMLDGGTGSQSIARLIANRAVLTGNLNASGNEAAVVTVVGPVMSAAGNLVTINRV
jgi:hypothetical protein